MSTLAVNGAKVVNSRGEVVHQVAGAREEQSGEQPPCFLQPYLKLGSVTIAPNASLNVILDCAAAAHFDIVCGKKAHWI